MWVLRAGPRTHWLLRVGAGLHFPCVEQFPIYISLLLCVFDIKVCTSKQWCINFQLFHNKLLQSEQLKTINIYFPAFVCQESVHSLTGSLAEVHTRLKSRSWLELWVYLKLKVIFQTWQNSFSFRYKNEALACWRPPAIPCHVTVNGMAVCCLKAVLLSLTSIFSYLIRSSLLKVIYLWLNQIQNVNGLNYICNFPLDIKHNIIKLRTNWQ